MANRLVIRRGLTKVDLDPPVIGYVEFEVPDNELFDIALTPVVHAGGDKPPRLASWQAHARTNTDIRPREAGRPTGMSDPGSTLTPWTTTTSASTTAATTTLSPTASESSTRCTLSIER